MNKEIKKSSGKETYLLGADKAGLKYYLKSPSWDCDWYWGFGYVQTYTYNDIGSHQHFDNLFLKGNCLKKFRNLITDTPLNEDEIWRLMELMESFYVLKKASELFKRGGGGISNNPCQNILKSDEKRKEINEVLLPAIFEQIKELFEEK